MRLYFIPLALLLFTTCSTGEDSLEIFSQCFPQEDYSIMSKAISALDSAVTERYSGQSTTKTYSLMADDFLQNPNGFNFPLTENKLKEINSAFNNAGIYDFFFTLNRSGKRNLNLNSDYFKCLDNTVANEEVQDYLERRRVTGDFSLTETMSIISQFNAKDYTPLTKFAIKTELLVIATYSIEN